MDWISFLISERSGQPSVVERDVHDDVPVGGDGDVVDHAEVRDAGVQLGIHDAREHAADVLRGGRRGGGRCLGIAGIDRFSVHSDE